VTLSWTADNDPLPDSVVAGAELILGRKLPSAYRLLAQAWPGGHPEPNEFQVKRGRRTWTSCVGVLMSLDPRHEDNIFECIKNLAVDDQLAHGLLPIIDDGGGDLVCLDYRSEPPAVVYWAHELGDEEAVVPICPSFDAFLELLATEGA
jgi:SMI1/KNR4 family protein SUKH-1